MNWAQLAFGLIKQAVTTEQGRDVINSLRSAMRRDGPEAATAPVDVVALLAEQRKDIDRNLETILQMVHAQNEQLLRTIRRLHVWNAALTAGLLVVLLHTLRSYF